MKLGGVWKVDKADHHTLADLGDVMLEFHGDGRLTYATIDDDRAKVINLTYKIDGNTIITDQPSAPRPERTTFQLSHDGVLTLAFGGIPYQFRRAE